MENYKFLDENKYLEVEEKFVELEDLLSRVEVMSDNKLYAFYDKQKKRLESFVKLFNECKNIVNDLKELQTITKTESDENTRLELQKELISQKYELETKEKNLISEYAKLGKKKLERVMIEVSSRSEYCLGFVVSIFEKFSNQNSFEYVFEKINNETILINISGEGVYENLKCFSGKYNIKTEAEENEVMVLVFKNLNEVFEFDERDLEIETLRSGGAGGQHINKTESAVRVSHKASGISVKVQDERSQFQNKEKAINLIKEKILQKNKENIENNIKNQKKQFKNAIFNEKYAFEFNIKQNNIKCFQNKKNYDLQSVIDGKLEFISSDLMEK